MTPDQQVSFTGDEFRAALAAEGASSAEESRVAVAIELWPQLEWLEDDGLQRVLRKVNRKAYAEGEEEGGWYVFYCLGLPLERLRDVVDDAVNKSGPTYVVAIADAPEHAVPSREVRVTAA